MLITRFGVHLSFGTLVDYDNRSAIQIAHYDVFHEWTEYIEKDCPYLFHLL